MTQSVAAIPVSSCLAFYVDVDRNHPFLLHIPHGHGEIRHGLRSHVNHPIDHHPDCHHCGGGRSNHHHNLFLPDNFDDYLHHRKIVYPLRMAYHYPLFLHLSKFDTEDSIHLVDNYLIHTNIYDVSGNQLRAPSADKKSQLVRDLRYIIYNSHWQQKQRIRCNLIPK